MNMYYNYNPYYRVNRLNESMSMETGNEDYIEKLGEIEVVTNFKTGETVKVKCSKIMQVCANGVYKLQRDYPYLYLFLKRCKLMYIPIFPSKMCDTMCVDNNNNLWINMHYVYRECKMDPNRVFGVLFHEMFHIFLDHLLRFRDKYPESMFPDASVYKKANMKANICMDYEVNASMVDDGIVDAKFWPMMNGLYKKEYTGMTWEEINDTYGDAEYKDWLKRNGYSLDDVELKILDAIEEASKVLLDPDATDEEKRYAREDLQDKIDKLLGRDSRKDGGLKDAIDDLAKTKLGDIDDIASDLDELSHDLYKNPVNMSDYEFDKTMRDLDKLSKDMLDNADDIADKFGKSSKSTNEDIQKAREALKDAVEKMKEGKLSKEEKQDLIDKAKDALEDIISTDAEKDKLAEKREKRDAEKEAARKEALKKKHPMRKIINVLKNIAELNKIDLVSEDTVEQIKKVIEALEPLTEKPFSDYRKSDYVKPGKEFENLSKFLIDDLVELIKNETILNKTEDDMKRLVEGVFKHVFQAFVDTLRKSLSESEKGSVINAAAQKLRIIGKVLKTQKVWRPSDEFKEAYIKEMKRLLALKKAKGDEALFKELYDKGAFDNIPSFPKCLDKKGQEIYHKLLSTGKIR